MRTNKGVFYSNLFFYFVASWNSGCIGLQYLGFVPDDRLQALPGFRILDIE